MDCKQSNPCEQRHPSSWIHTDKTLALPFLLLEYKPKTLQPSSSRTKVVYIQSGSQQIHSDQGHLETTHSRNPASYWSQSQKCDTVRTYLINIRTMIEIHSILQGLRAALSYHTYITCNVQAYLQTWSESSVKSLVRFTSYTYTKRLSVIPNKYWRRVWASSSYSEN